MNREIAMKAASWWGNKLKGNIRHDNGSDDDASKMAGFLADMMTTPSSDDTIDKFEKILVEKILEENSNYVDLYVDYHPDRVLAEAANEAGIDEMSFPWKTGVHIRNDKVTVSDGYGTGFTEI